MRTHVHKEASTAKNKRERITLRTLTPEQRPAAPALAQRVFDEYESPDYPPEGTAEFHRALRDESYLPGIRFTPLTRSADTPR